MKKFTLMLLAAFVGVLTYAQAPRQFAKGIEAPAAGQLLQNAGKVDAPRTTSLAKIKAPRKAAEDYVVITEQPEGELKKYTRAGYQYYVSGNSLYYRAQSGSIDIVFGDDNKVYLKDIVSGLAYGTYVEGTLSEDGQTITVALGQNILYSANYDACIAIHLVNYIQGTGMVADFETEEVTFTVSEDGVIALQGTALADVSLGATWTDDNTFQNYGDFESVYTPYTPNVTLVTLPEGLDAVEMPISGTFYDSFASYQSRESEQIDGVVRVARDDTEFYFQGLIRELPEAWVVGELVDGEISIPVTYMGTIEGESVYAMAYSSNGPAPITFIYDEREDGEAFYLDGYIMPSPEEMSLNLNTVYSITEGVVIGQLPEAVAAPEDLETKALPFKGVLYDGSSETEFEDYVNVGFDGEDVYFQNLVAEVPDAWVKGTFNEDHTQVIIPCSQYVGISANYGVPVFLLSGETIYEEDEDGEEEAVGTELTDIVFDYDANTNFFELQNNIYVNYAKSQEIYYIAVIEQGATIGTKVDALWIAADQGYENAQDVTEIYLDVDDSAADEEEEEAEPSRKAAPAGHVITMGKLDKAEGSNAPKYYNTGSAVRLYAGNTLTITSEKTIAKLVFTMTGSDKQKQLGTDEGDIVLEGTTATWTGEAKDIVFTVPSTSGAQARIQRIEVYYLNYAETLVAAPEDLVTEEYRLKATDTYSGEETSYAVQVGFDGNTVYFQGLSDYLPEAWVKGELVDGQVTIPTWFMGTFNYLWYSFDLVFSGATFTYDAEAGVFTTDEFQTISTNGSYFDGLADVVITKVQDVAATPATPEVTRLQIAETGYPNVKFNIPAEDVDGNPLLTSKLSYVILIETEEEGVTELTLTTDLYTDIEEDMTEIPYDFTDNYDIYVAGATVYLNQDVEEMYNWKQIGVQSIYRGGNEEHKSEIGWYDVAAYWLTTGINEVATAGTTVYFDLQGRAADQNARGLLIKQTRMADGTVKTVKVVRK